MIKYLIFVKKRILMKEYKYTYLENDILKESSIIAENARSARSKLIKIQKENEEIIIDFPKRFKGVRIKSEENEHNDNGFFDKNDDKDIFQSENMEIQENDKKEPNSQEFNNNDVKDIGRANDNQYFSTPEPLLLKSTENFTEEEKQRVSDYENQNFSLNISNRTDEKTNDVIAISNLLPTILISLMTLINSFLPAKIFNIKKIDKEEKKMITESFQDAFPNTTVNPKLAFFSVLALILGSRIDLSKLNKDE